MGIAALLGCLIGGWAGAIYNEQPLKGVVCLVCGMVFAAITGCAALLVIYPVGIIDSVLIAQRINRGERGAKHVMLVGAARPAH